MAITITRIERQKKNKQRYSLYSDDKFIIGVSEDSLLEFNIHTGLELSEELVLEIEQKENIVATREQAWRFLARRMHSRKELRDKLVAKKYTQNNIEIIINELEKRKYLDDRSFAQLIITDEINLKKSGPLLIRNKLQKKGVDNTIISTLLEDLYDEQLQYENCRYFAYKKHGSLRNDDISSARGKLGNFLTQTGFSWEMCNYVISELEFE